VVETYRNRWTGFIGTGGRELPESVSETFRNRWSIFSGIRTYSPLLAGATLLGKGLIDFCEYASRVDAAKKASSSHGLALILDLRRLSDDSRAGESLCTGVHPSLYVEGGDSVVT
ncbi:MAG: hypothetical protein ACM3X4_02115, partial [Ignavibacteriales bacterium]